MALCTNFPVHCCVAYQDLPSCNLPNEYETPPSVNKMAELAEPPITEIDFKKKKKQKRTKKKY